MSGGKNINSKSTFTEGYKITNIKTRTMPNHKKIIQAILSTTNPLNVIHNFQPNHFPPRLNYS